MNELFIKAQNENLSTVLGFVDELLEAEDCPRKAKFQIDLAVEEIFVNISNYAYDPETGDALIRVEVIKDPLRVVLTFIDNGRQYDPLAREDPDVTKPLEERPTGGLGIFLVKKNMDDISYEYKNGQNILTIKKNL